MQRSIPMFFLLLGLLTGCVQPLPSPTASPTENSVPRSSPGVPTLERDETPAWVACRIVDGAEEGELLLAELEHELAPHEDSRHDGRSVYRLSLNKVRCYEEPGPDGNTLAVMTANGGVCGYLDGEPAQASDLKDGMNVEISFNGTVLESFPAQFGEAYELHAWSIGSEQCPGGSYYDLCGLYLQVLDDLWRKDPGLNSNIAIAGLDLSEAPGELLESEKEALSWRFGEIHGVEAVRGSYEELAAEGYFTPVSDDPGYPLYQWENGCLFSITAAGGHEEEAYSLPTLFFDAEKWCSPLGAYYFKDCFAAWPEMGTWSGYTIGGEAIS